MLKGKWTICIATILILCLSSVVLAQKNVREYQMKQAGGVLGTIKVEIYAENDKTYLNTLVKYPGLNTEIATNYLFSGESFPKKPVEYNFSILQGGILDFSLIWNDSAEYTVKQLGISKRLSTTNVLALDNNAISDYMVTTWLLPRDPQETFAGNLILPAQILQSDLPLPMQISFVDSLNLGGYEAEHYQVDIGLVMDIWVDAKDRNLLKLHIPMQAYEIILMDLKEEDANERVFNDFGGYDFKEKIVLVPAEDGARISGTWTIPSKLSEDVKVPAAIIVAGSGPTDRDGNSYILPGPADYLKEIAHFLASQGIATLRFDKRGVGESQGTVTSFTDFISDIDLLVDHAQAQVGIDPSQIFLIGHSEGAWLVSEVAVKRQELAGIVLLSGAGFPFFDTIKRQLKSQGEALVDMGLYDGNLNQRLMSALDDMYHSILNDTHYSISEYDLPAEFEQPILGFIYQKDLIKDWLIADPTKVLSQVTIPVLIVQGTADSQIQVADARALAAVLPEEQYKLSIFPDLDHVLKITYGQPLPYVDPERRVDRELLHTLENWIKGIR